MNNLSRNAPTAGLVLLTLVAIGLNAAGLIPDAPAVTAIVSALLLVFGLPHGSFDLALLRRAGTAGQQLPSRLATSTPNPARLALVLLYLGCAALMYLAWRLGPVPALASFLILAVVHFAEDWDDCGSRFMAVGIAGAIVTAPAILHRAQLGDLLVVMTGDSSAAALADVMLLVAPTALAVAIVGIGVAWQAGRRIMAVSAGCALAATLLLPPVPGFALFFCLVHSPLQFRHHAERLGLRGVGQWGAIVVPLSLAGLGIAVAVLVFNDRASLTTGVFAASFMTLSILTVPHMLVPMFVERRAPARQLAPA